MASNTTNLNLIKPAGSERVQISQINQNMDILDEKIGAVGNTSLQGQITNLGNRIDTEVSSKQYNLGQLTSDTLANQIYAFANAHRQMNGYTGAFYLSATAVPSDLPAQTNEWKYAHGHFHIRHSNATGVADGEIVLYGFNTNRIAIKNMANNTVTSNWAIINGAYTFSNASDLYSFVTELNSYVSEMVNYDSRNVAVEFTAASSPFTSSRYIGTLTKTSDSRAQLTLHQHNAPVIIYGIQNGTTWQWDSYALGSQLPNVYRWMDATRTGITQNAGANYWTLTTQFPAKTGYSRRIMHMETNNQNVVVVRCNINADGSVTVYTYNLSNTSQSFNINGVFAYLSDASKD